MRVKKKQGHEIAKQFQQPRQRNSGPNRLAKGALVMAAADNIYKYLPNQARRSLEDDEELLLQRDFENSDEELFGREYDDFLVERDAFDDLD
jgi:hypothetical protein